VNLKHLQPEEKKKGDIYSKKVALPTLMLLVLMAVKRAVKRQVLRP
jgi:hypothetical protein